MIEINKNLPHFTYTFAFTCRCKARSFWSPLPGEKQYVNKCQHAYMQLELINPLISSQPIGLPCPQRNDGKSLGERQSQIQAKNHTQDPIMRQQAAKEKTHCIQVVPKMLSKKQQQLIVEKQRETPIRSQHIGVMKEKKEMHKHQQNQTKIATMQNTTEHSLTILESTEDKHQHGHQTSKLHPQTNSFWSDWQRRRHQAFIQRQQQQQQNQSVILNCQLFGNFESPVKTNTVQLQYDPKSTRQKRQQQKRRLKNIKYKRLNSINKKSLYHFRYRHSPLIPKNNKSILSLLLAIDPITYSVATNCGKWHHWHQRHLESHSDSLARRRRQLWRRLDTIRGQTDDTWVAKVTAWRTGSIHAAATRHPDILGGKCAYWIRIQVSQIRDEMRQAMSTSCGVWHHWRRQRVQEVGSQQLRSCIATIKCHPDDVCNVWLHRSQCSFNMTTKCNLCHCARHMHKSWLSCSSQIQHNRQICFSRGMVAIMQHLWCSLQIKSKSILELLYNPLLTIFRQHKCLRVQLTKQRKTAHNCNGQQKQEAKQPWLNNVQGYKICPYWAILQQRHPRGLLTIDERRGTTQLVLMLPDGHLCGYTEAWRNPHGPQLMPADRQKWAAHSLGHNHGIRTMDERRGSTANHQAWPAQSLGHNHGLRTMEERRGSSQEGVMLPEGHLVGNKEAWRHHYGPQLMPADHQTWPAQLPRHHHGLRTMDERCARLKPRFTLPQGHSNDRKGAWRHHYGSQSKSAFLMLPEGHRHRLKQQTQPSKCSICPTWAFVRHSIMKQKCPQRHLQAHMGALVSLLLLATSIFTPIGGESTPAATLVQPPPRPGQRQQQQIHQKQYLYHHTLQMAHSTMLWRPSHGDWQHRQHRKAKKTRRTHHKYL